MKHEFSSVSAAKAHAKEHILPHLQSVLPEAKYCNALELLAREAGYESWRAFTAYLESPQAMYGLERLGNGVTTTYALIWPDEDDLDALKNFRDQFTSIRRAVGSPRYQVELREDFGPWDKETWFWGDDKETLVATLFTGGDPIRLVWDKHPDSVWEGMTDEEAKECVDFNGFWFPSNLHFKWDDLFDYRPFSEFFPHGKEELALNPNANPNEVVALFLQEVIETAYEFDIEIYEQGSMIEEIENSIKYLEIRNDHFNPQAHIVREVDEIWSFHREAYNAFSTAECFDGFFDSSERDNLVRQAEKKLIEVTATARERTKNLLQKYPRRTLNQRSRAEVRELISTLRTKHV